MDNKVLEKIIMSDKASCFGTKDNIDGVLVLTNLRIFLQINEEEKIKEIMLDDMKSISAGGINVLRIEKKDNESHSFLVKHLFKWLSTIKKAKKDLSK